MQRRLLVATIAACGAFALAACSGQRPSLSDAADASAGAARGSVGKVAVTDPKAGDTSVVATATVPRVDVFDSTTASKPSRTLANPIASGGPLVFLVVESTREWHHVMLPVRPNGSTGWIRASDVSLTRHNYRIVVTLAQFRLDVLQAGKVMLQAPIGVARDNTPTPGGRYYTTELLRPPTPDSVYGSYAYGLSGYSDVLETFNGGPGQLGIHGTNDPASIGQRVSAGCIRLRNADIERLAKRLPLGVPVDVMT